MTSALSNAPAPSAFSMGKAKRLERPTNSEPPSAATHTWNLQLAGEQNPKVTMVCLPGQVFACPPGPLDWSDLVNSLGPVTVQDFESRIGICKLENRPITTKWDEILTSGDFRRMRASARTEC